MTDFATMERLICHRPTIGGTAHLTRQRRKPPVPLIVENLCGATYSVSTEAKPRTSECPACGDAFHDRFDLPRRRETLAADPSHPSATDPEHGVLPPQSTGTGAPLARPVPVGQLDRAS